MISGPQPEFFTLMVGVEPRDLDIWRDNPDEIVLDEPDLVITNVKIGERRMLGFSTNVKVGRSSTEGSWTR